MLIVDFLKPEAVVAHLSATSKAGVLTELSAALARAYRAVPEERFLQVLQEREKIGSTGMEKGVAIPHGRLAEISSLVACFGVSHDGIEFDARDGKPSNFFFALVAPDNSPGLHLKALSKLSRIFRSDALKDSLLAAQTAEAMYTLISQEDARV